MAEKTEVKTRLYVVEDASGHKRIVRAAHPSQAIRHVAAGAFKHRVPDQDELFTLASMGVKIEEAGSDVNEAQEKLAL